MEERKLGVLGGMGPLATSVFLEKLIENTVAHKDQDHINTIILNHATLPDRTEAILENKEHGFINAIENDVKLLEQIGVKNIAMPCNTSHYFYESIQAMTHVNIINMVQKTIEYIRLNYGTNSKVGILATDGTIASGVYTNECKKNTIIPHNPNSLTQKRVMDTIYNIKADVDFHPKELECIIEDLITNENCTCVILGCTELSCVSLDESIKKYCIDPMDILVEESIQLSGKQSIHTLDDSSPVYSKA